MTMTPDALRALIAATGLNNTEFARELGMTDASYIRKMLRGGYPISDNMERDILAAHRRLTAEWLWVISRDGDDHVARGPIDLAERVPDGSTWRQSDAWYRLVGRFFDVENLRHEENIKVVPLIDAIRIAIEDAQADEDDGGSHLAYAADLLDLARQAVRS